MKQTATATTYVWQGFGTLNVNPTKAYEHIHDTMKNKLGREPNKTDVFNDAQDKKSILHNAIDFDWNETSAAKKHNIGVAQRLLDGLRVQYVEVIGHKKIVKTRPATVTIVRNPKMGNRVEKFGNRFGRNKRLGFTTEIVEYVEAMKQPDVRNMQIDEAITMVESWQVRFKSLDKQANVFMQKAKERLKKIKK